jgi:hypothetical protein
MAITFVNDAATIGTTEYSLPADSTTLTDQTDDCILQVWIDFGAMTVTEQYEWKVTEKINAGTMRIVATGTVTGAQTGPVVTPSLVVGDAWNVTVKKLAGTDRSIGWSLRKLT